MGNREEQLQEAYKDFTSVWLFYRKYFDVSDSDAYWEAVIQEANVLYNTTKTPLIRALLGVVTTELERKMRNER